MTSTLSKLRFSFIHFLPSEVTSATLGLTFILIIEPSRLPWRIQAARVPLLTNLSRRFYSAVISSALPWMFVSSPHVETQQTCPRGCALTSTVCCQRKPGIWWSVPFTVQSSVQLCHGCLFRPLSWKSRRRALAGVL